MQGKPLAPVIESDMPLREAALFGLHGGQVNVTDGRYVYMRNYRGVNGPLYNYTLMPTHMRSLFRLDELRTMTPAPPFSFTKGCPLMRFDSIPDPASDIEPKVKYPDMLFDLKTDPEQKTPLHDSETENRMLCLMARLMRENDAPAEQYVRLGLDENA